MSHGKRHLDMDRLDTLTILPPPGPSCKITLNERTYLHFTHVVQIQGLPSFDCEHPECVVNSVHDA